MGGQYWEEAQHARKLATKAAQLMDESGFAPIPVNYELFFFYALGQNRALHDAVDGLLRQGRAVDAAGPQELHRKFFGGLADSDVSDASSVLETELQNLAKCLNATNAGSSEFTRSLDAASQQLLRSDAPRAIRDLIDNVAAATKIMAATNQRLQAQVELSGKELDALQTKLQDVRRESLSDALTGLANRRSFDLQIAQAVQDAEASSVPLSVLMCDIDHFKKFNDTWGHATGDQVLRLVANCVSSNVKGRDTAARYGGEELVVILPNTALSEALILAEQIRKSVESRKIVKKSTGESYGTITLSIGVAEFKLKESVESLLGRADACLYGAKHDGRNRVNAILPSDAVQQQSGKAKSIGHAGKQSRSAGSVMELEFHDQHTEICVDPEVTLDDEALRVLQAWWIDASKGGLPIWTQSLLLHPAFSSGLLQVHKVLDDGDRFQVRHVSKGLTELLGYDICGMVLSATPSGNAAIAPTLKRIFEISKLTSKIGSPVRTYSKSSHVFSSGKYSAETLCLPLSESGKSVDFILGATVFSPN